MVYATPTGHPIYGIVPGGAATTGGVVPVLYAPHAPGVMYMQQDLLDQSDNFVSWQKSIVTVQISVKAANWAHIG